MRTALVLLTLAAASLAQTSTEQISHDDAIRVREFYRLADQLQDGLWPGWSRLPAPLLLVTPDQEFLTHHPSPPVDFRKAGDLFYARPRHFAANLLATFPAFGPPSVIVVGEPKDTASKTSTAWLITLMHEHFHQLQNAQPGYSAAVNALGLSRGDNTGMWMLNYAFPYDDPEVAASFLRLRDALLQALNETDQTKFSGLARDYLTARKEFFSRLSPDDRKYFDFQLWQEGVARYTEIKVAEAAANYKPTSEFAALSDFEDFTGPASQAQKRTLAELREVDLAKSKRLAVYPFGAAEGLLLDRLTPEWRKQYFSHLLSMEPYFER